MGFGTLLGLLGFGLIGGTALSVLGGVVGAGTSIAKGVEDVRQIKEEERRTVSERQLGEEQLAKEARYQKGLSKVSQASSAFSPHSQTYLQNLFGIDREYERHMEDLVSQSNRRMYDLERERKSAIASSTVGALQETLGAIMSGVAGGMDTHEKIGQELADSRKAFASKVKTGYDGWKLDQQEKRYLIDATKMGIYKGGSIKQNNRSF